MTSLENQTLPYLDHKRAGVVPPHLVAAFHVYVHAVRSQVDLGGCETGTVARVARIVRLVESDAEALAWDERGAMVRWSA